MVKETGSHGKAWCELAKKYGPIVGLKLGLADPMIIVSGRDAVMEMLSRSEFDGRPNGFIFTHRTMGKKRGILFTDGKVWTDQRRYYHLSFYIFKYICVYMYMYLSIKNCQKIINMFVCGHFNNS